MGALPPLTHTSWIPKDDLLLKNSIEAGASLESLAKGAVEFSRRFTIQELQERWHSLLYDSTVSTDASVRMMEFERCASNPPSMSCKADNSKENKSVEGKRKAESIRRCYYAMRKRICNEPLSADLGFLVQPCDYNISDGGANNMLGHPGENYFGVEDSNFGDPYHVFSEEMGNIAPAFGLVEFPNGLQNTIECSTEVNAGHNEILHMVGNSVSADGKHAGFEDIIIPSEELVGSGIFVPNNDTEPILGCNAKEIMCSDYEDHMLFSSPTSDSVTSFNSLQCLSTLDAMPVWEPIDGTPVLEMPVDVSTMDYYNVPNRNPFSVSDNDTEFYNYDSTGCTLEYFDELLNFSDNDGENDDNYNLLEDSWTNLLKPVDDVDADNMPITPEQLESVAPNANPDIPSSKDPEENNTADPHLDDTDNLCDSILLLPSFASVVNLQFPEYCDGVICCTLNAEDPDIPCNDHVVFPSKARPANRKAQNAAGSPALYTKHNTDNQTGEKGKGTMKKDIKQLVESHPSSQTDELGARGPSQNGLAVKKELLDHPMLWQPGFVSNESGHVSGLGGVQTGGCVAGELGHVSDLSHVQGGFDGISQEFQAASAIRDHDLYGMKFPDSMALESGLDPLLSDRDELYSESDADIPCCSDVESMILGMDLGPDCQDSLSSKEVAQYQHEDAKRAIIRYEQNADSCMQRAIASHGAFAVLHGRFSKHYIKKAEVVLGRATNDNFVDIDLGRDGPPNKMSRRQALIKIDKDTKTLNLKNLAKCSIYVNDKELVSGQSIVLHSNCVIEIKRKYFIFEINQSRVKEYLDRDGKKSKAKVLNI